MWPDAKRCQERGKAIKNVRGISPNIFYSTAHVHCHCPKPSLFQLFNMQHCKSGNVPGMGLAVSSVLT